MMGETDFGFKVPSNTDDRSNAGVKINATYAF